VVAAAVAATLIGVPKIAMRLGLYTFNAALAGLGIALFIFPGQGITAGLLAMEILGGVLCVFITAALSGFLSKYEVPSLALPYCTTLLILVPASLAMSRIQPTTGVLPYLNVLADYTHQTWTAAEFFTAVMNNFSEVLWQANVISGFFFLAGLLLSSRVDVIIAIIGSVLASGFAILLGLPQANNLIGIYGYNAVLLMLVLFGRGYAMTVKNFFFTLVMGLITVPLTAAMAGIFAPLGIPVAAFPYALVAVFSLASKDALTGLKWISPLKWGVPETIAAELKKEK
jgi:urea transporter